VCIAGWYSDGSECKKKIRASIREADTCTSNQYNAVEEGYRSPHTIEKRLEANIKMEHGYGRMQMRRIDNEWAVHGRSNDASCGW
jgi:hypothetical protein